jgi:hypothetical protein
VGAFLPSATPPITPFDEGRLGFSYAAWLDFKIVIFGWDAAAAA